MFGTLFDCYIIGFLQLNYKQLCYDFFESNDTTCHVQTSAGWWQFVVYFSDKAALSISVRHVDNAIRMDLKYERPGANTIVIDIGVVDRIAPPSLIEMMLVSNKITHALKRFNELKSN